MELRAGDLIHVTEEHWGLPVDNKTIQVITPPGENDPKLGHLGLGEIGGEYLVEHPNYNLVGRIIVSTRYIERL